MSQKVSVSVVAGDITRMKVDALITAINSGGLWFGCIDGAIQRAAGNMFHQQAANVMPLRDGQIVVARSHHGHNAAFGNVIFVVDDLKRPLHEVVLGGLQAASDAGFKSVSLPTIRMGVMLGVVEKSVAEAITEMSAGVRQFLGRNPNTSLGNIVFVVYNDPKTQSLLREAMPE